jgi:nitrate reductase gamma subunit
MFYVLTAAAAIFFIGNAWRVVATLRMPRPLRWDLYPIPRGPIERQRYGGSYFEDTDWWTRAAHGLSLTGPLFVVKEVLFLKSVYENFHDLWVWSWLLHWGLYLYIGTTAFSLFGAPGSVVQLLYFVATFFGCIGAAGLLRLRLTDDRLREHSSRSTFFNLQLLALFFASGALAANAGFTPRNALSNSGLPVQLHLATVAFFLAYFPFTHMTHAFMKFFTWHQVRWDDSASIHNPSASAVLAQHLELPVSWSAAHIAGEGTRSWRDVVTGDKQP